MIVTYGSAVVLLFGFLEAAVRGQSSAAAPTPALDTNALARRNDGVFFGLGGLDASLMPFDLDAFFEHAAPTRTTSSVAAAPSKKLISIASTSGVGASHRSAFSANRPAAAAAATTSQPRNVEFTSGGGRSPLVTSRSGPHRQAPVHIQSLRNSADGALRGRFSGDDRQKPSRFTDFQGDDSAEKLRASQRHRFVRPEPQQRQPEPVTSSAADDRDQRRRPIPILQSFGISGSTRDDDIRPIQHVPFRPSLTTSAGPSPIRFGGPSIPSTIPRSSRPEEGGSRSPSNRFGGDAESFPEVRRPPNAILNFPSESPRSRHHQPSTEEEDRPSPRPSFSNRDPTPTRHQAESSIETTDRSRPIQQFDFSSEDERRSPPPSPQSSSNLLDGVSAQDPPAQEVDVGDNVDDEQQDFRGGGSRHFANDGPDFFEPSTENTEDDRAPSSEDELPPQEEEQTQDDNGGGNVRSGETDSPSHNRQPASDDRFVSTADFRQAQPPPAFERRPQQSFAGRNSARTVSEDEVPNRFHGKVIDDDTTFARHPSTETEDAPEPDLHRERQQSPPRVESAPTDTETPSDVFSRHRPPRGRHTSSFVRQNIGTPRQLSSIVDDVTAEQLDQQDRERLHQQQQQPEDRETPTGQLSASFARATEPTVFEVESDESHDRQPPVKVLRRKLIGRRRKLFHPTAVLQRDSSLHQQHQQQQQQQQQTSSNHGRDFDYERFPQRSSSSSAQGSSSNVVQTSNDVQTATAPRKRLPQTDALTRSTAARATRFGHNSIARSRSSSPSSSSAHRMTTPTQFVTENVIDDFGPSSRHQPIEQNFGQDSRVSSVVVPGQPATSCNPLACQLPKCFCGGNQLRPGNLRPEDTPQIIVLTFDDAVNDLNWALYTRLFFKDRRNPNGCPIQSTFYVSHEWTDYSKVQNLYAQGHEIASHSISHGDGRDYSKQKWYNEIYGQKEIMSVYANVRPEDVKGMRSPFLAMGGDQQFSMLYETNFTYDSSMTVTDVHPPYWPYTLDYAIPHRCAIPPCPKLTYPGFWEIPMVALTDLNGGKCSMADGCSHSTTEEGIYEMLMKNFERHYKSNRAPFGLYYHASWFLIPHRQEGFVKFLEDIMKRDDVYLVTALQMLEWVKNPTPISKIKDFEPWMCSKSNRPPPCNRPRSCELRFKGDVRYMSTCHTCPEVYPWVGDTGVTKSAFTISQ